MSKAFSLEERARAGVSVRAKGCSGASCTSREISASAFFLLLPTTCGCPGGVSQSHGGCSTYASIPRRSLQDIVHDMLSLCPRVNLGNSNPRGIFSPPRNVVPSHGQNRNKSVTSFSVKLPNWCFGVLFCTPCMDSKIHLKSIGSTFKVDWWMWMDHSEGAIWWIGRWILDG